ncbi:MAG: hypothetical protein HC896_10105 [Bacteroidales bacterium]|nr:hypothetical protein [Bacteroidales bacterium]
MEEYYRLIKTDVEEQKNLLNDCLIGVTAFFRDPGAFDFIKETLLPQLFPDKGNKPSVRFWVAGCSTGEEAYSMAILIDEYLSEKKQAGDYKIFATDADQRSLQIASAGLYPINLVTDISKERLEKYFIKSGNHFEVLKKLREKIVFSYHNILKDPPFIRMDQISCRNLLIYMNNKSQRKIINTFQFSLNLNGYLFLGNSENVSDIKDCFEVIDAKWRIYKNISTTKVLPSHLAENKLGSFNAKHPGIFELSTQMTKKKLPEHVFNKNLAEQFGPACIYIDASFNVLFLNGNVGDYLDFNRGPLKENLLEMVNNEKLLAMLRNGVRRLREERKAIVFKKFAIENKGQQQLVNLRFKEVKIESHHQEVYVILFEKLSIGHEDAVVMNNFKVDDLSKQQIQELERDLKVAKEETQNAIEELETSNEELQASNEELQASNEELQSTNEELQSVNEELYTINSELQVKNTELRDLNNDMSNLLASTSIAVLFLNNDLKIRMFTPELKRIFKFEESDINRSIEGFASNFVNINGKQLAIDVRQVLQTLKPITRELASEDHSVFIKRILPYRTINNQIEGAVITFVDITEVRKMDIELKQLANRLEEAMKIGSLAWWDWDCTTGKVPLAMPRPPCWAMHPTSWTTTCMPLPK